MRADLRGGWEAVRKVDWWFLASLMLGAAAAVLTLAKVIEDTLHDHPVRTAGLFLGMIVATIVLGWRLLGKATRTHALIAVGVGLGAFALFGLQSATVVDPSPTAYFFAGMLAICAFILPGVSGSFMLLAIGMYQSVLGAVNDRELATVAVFAFGAVLGLGFFSRLLERLLERHFDTVVSVLIGLMLGSFRILWPWPNGLGDEDGVGATVLAAPSGEVAIPILLAVSAFGAVVMLGVWAERRAN